jgi:hypothetical protein
MAGKTVNALTPIDASGGKVFVEGEYWSATNDTLNQTAFDIARANSSWSHRCKIVRIKENPYKS